MQTFSGSYRCTIRLSVSIGCGIRWLFLQEGTELSRDQRKAIFLCDLKGYVLAFSRRLRSDTAKSFQDLHTYLDTTKGEMNSENLFCGRSLVPIHKGRDGLSNHICRTHSTKERRRWTFLLAYLNCFSRKQV